MHFIHALVILFFSYSFFLKKSAIPSIFLASVLTRNRYTCLLTLLIYFVKCLDQNQDRQNRSGSKKFDTPKVFMRDCFDKVYSKNNSADDKKVRKKLPSMQIVKIKTTCA